MGPDARGGEGDSAPSGFGLFCEPVTAARASVGLGTDGTARLWAPWEGTGAGRRALTFP
jgi:hypothetical protein